MKPMKTRSPDQNSLFRVWPVIIRGKIRDGRVALAIASSKSQQSSSCQAFARNHQLKYARQVLEKWDSLRLNKSWISNVAWCLTSFSNRPYPFPAIRPSHGLDAVA
jgi:hypothetical protein